ncbi:Hypothetical predicted protein [Mytilus galloprovincialis]|uniref:Uncharacterized protein n=1 Tax=Mytilus galloprovincialis TaxID=29158 RepID=A0A8B6CDN2_MYTGA|nr:Hypothetical predicted protein [Mytilus galloprovincialis]
MKAMIYQLKCRPWTKVYSCDRVCTLLIIWMGSSNLSKPSKTKKALMAAFDSLTRQFGSLEVNASTINKDNEHAGCSQRVKEVMDEGNDKPADAPGKSLDEGLLLRKGVYPYDYVDGFEKLQETELPPSEALYNTITGEGVDFEYLKELHDYHNGYSLAPETVQLNKVKKPRRQTEVCCILRQPKTVLARSDSRSEKTTRL